MKTLLVGKAGSTFRMRDSGRAVGEQGETEGVLRHLCERQDVRVVYFGQSHGELPCEHVEPHLEGVHENMTDEHQRERWKEDISSLEPYAPFIGFINVAGMCPTMSTVENPNGARIQASAARYTAPMLNVLEHFKIPRIVVNNDPRTYPRDQEMSMHMPWARPAALLDQCDREVRQVVGGVAYTRRSVYAAAESWAWQLRRMNTDECPCVCIAHCHIGDGVRAKAREDAFGALFGGDPPCHVFGKGWEAFSGYRPDVYHDAVPPWQALDYLRQSTCCPVVGLEDGFYSGKPFVLESQGCIPILYGRGEPHTWDPYGKYVSLEDTLKRTCARGGLEETIRMLEHNSSLRVELREEWNAILKPRWEKLDQLVGDLIDGRDFHDESWFRDYGGYFPSPV